MIILGLFWFLLCVVSILCFYDLRCPCEKEKSDNLLVVIQSVSCRDSILTELLKLQKCAYTCLVDLVEIWFSRSGSGLWFCISHRLPGDINVSGPLCFALSPEQAAKGTWIWPLWGFCAPQVVTLPLHWKHLRACFNYIVTGVLWSPCWHESA